jgi:inner membrane protein involved in colicin E2 resistance
MIGKDKHQNDNICQKNARIQKQLTRISIKTTTFIKKEKTKTVNKDKHQNGNKTQKKQIKPKTIDKCKN